MTFVNRSGDEYLPIGYSGVDIDFSNPNGVATADEQGLYYRSPILGELQQQISDAKSGKITFDTLTLDAEQMWNERGWKELHGSSNAADRFTKKFREERREADDALWDYFENGNTEAFIDEIGDLKWVASALASNCGIVTSDAVKQRLFDYVHGSRQFDHGVLVKPSWYDAAGRMAVKYGPLNLGEVDDLMIKGFIPQHSATMNIYDVDEEDSSPSFYLDDMLTLGAFLSMTGPAAFEQGVTMFKQPPLTVHEGGRHYAEIYLRIASMAHYVGSTLTEVVAHNINKVDHRIKTDRIDKEDGDRD